MVGNLKALSGFLHQVHATSVSSEGTWPLLPEGHVLGRKLPSMQGVGLGLQTLVSTIVHRNKLPTIAVAWEHDPVLSI